MTQLRGIREKYEADFIWINDLPTGPLEPHTIYHINMKNGRLRLFLTNELGTAREVARAGSNSNQYVLLDEQGKIPADLLPDAILGQLEYVGTLDLNGAATGSYPTKTISLENNRPIRPGDYIIIQNAREPQGTTIGGKIYHTGDWAVKNEKSGNAGWDKVDNSDSVISVNGKHGVITLYATDISLSSANSTTLFQAITAIEKDIKTLDELAVKSVNDQKPDGSGNVALYGEHIVVGSKTAIGRKWGPSNASKWNSVVDEKRDAGDQLVSISGKGLGFQFKQAVTAPYAEQGMLVFREITDLSKHDPLSFKSVKRYRESFNHIYVRVDAERPINLKDREYLVSNKYGRAGLPPGTVLEVTWKSYVDDVYFLNPYFDYLDGDNYHNGKPGHPNEGHDGWRYFEVTNDLAEDDRTIYEAIADHEERLNSFELGGSLAGDENIIEEIKLNGSKLTVEDDKSVNIKLNGAISTVIQSNLSANRVVTANGSGKLAVSSVTTNELFQLTGAKSNIQKQIDDNYKAFLDFVNLDGK